MRLGPPSHLHGFGEAAHVADVHPRKVGQVLLDEGQELPLAGELLAHGKGHGGQLAQRGIGFRALVADRLFQEVERSRGQALAERGGLGHTEAVVIVNAQHDLAATLLAHLGQPFSSDGDAGTGSKMSESPVKPPAPSGIIGRRADHAPAMAHQQFDVVDERGPAPVAVAKQGISSRCLPPSS